MLDPDSTLVLAPGARYEPLPYTPRLPLRDPASIDVVVMHCTETPTLASAREFGERVLYPDTGTGASGHYYIDRDGALFCYVEPERIANHVRGWNPRSVGVEIVNTGRTGTTAAIRRWTSPTPTRRSTPCSRCSRTFKADSRI